MYARNPLKAKPYSLRKQMMISLPPTYHCNGSLIIIRQTTHGPYRHIQVHSL